MNINEISAALPAALYKKSLKKFENLTEKISEIESLTEELAERKPIKGERGIQGPAGGPQRPRGDKGDQGDQGIQGPKGDKGEPDKDATVPDISKFIEPYFNKAKDELDTFVVKSDKDFKSWKAAVNNQLSSIGGGGEVWLDKLNDVDYNKVRIDKSSLTYDSDSRKWVGIKHLPLTGDIITGDLEVEGNALFGDEVEFNTTPNVNGSQI